ncbi:hypothetical protein K2173_018759 [Erythroxylum novogranatense]|uniref:Protein Mpv17 n=1 Tax=Erythroxylum novogranatense TaxID=1862640 RepID=A0AAV8SB62_9ROSI|nr:hypothetical protein K2173_018759 [Erythroxylum novogranatense]
MGALGVDGGFWGWNWDSRRRRRKPLGSNASSGSTGRGGRGYQFPSKQAVTAGSLALTGDTIAQVTERWRKAKSFENDSKDILQTIFLHHDWFRALRMTSYGFLLYGPGSYAWYQFLDCHLPDQTLPNLLLKVLLNQIVLGPSVIAIVFAWNNLWQGKLSQLPQKYRKDALPTLLYGFRFWIPVSVLNFWVIPLQARVAFMSTGSIFWNFCLSSTMSRG